MIEDCGAQSEDCGAQRIAEHRVRIAECGVIAVKLLSDCGEIAD